VISARLPNGGRECLLRMKIITEAVFLVVCDPSINEL
jgi:hypothetical protein